MAQCEAELALSPAALTGPTVRLIGEPVRGIVEVSVDGAAAAIEKLFVDPIAMGEGLGRRLVEWATATAGEAGARRLTVEADPGAVPFYQRMGMQLIGEAPSGSIPGRMLPVLALRI